MEVDETSKKYCNRTTNDFVDIGNNTMPPISSNFATAASSCQRYKRQRDCITPQQNIQITESKSSPEQAKKRVCSYNNDITSSLSSSIKYKSTKRSSVAQNLNQTMPTNLESYEIQKSKMQRYIDHHNNDKNNTRVDVRFDNLENTLRNVDSIKPITPIPATPCTQEKESEGVAPKRTVSEPVYNPERKIAMNSIQPANKPRLTLFNKKYEDDESSLLKKTNETELENANDVDDFGECAGIPFVKPKKISSISGLRNPVIERTQKSKLALMLSGLRGELYQNSDVDELDSAKEKSRKIEEVKSNVILTTATSSMQSTTTTVTTSTTAKSASNVGISTASSTFSLSKITTSPPVALNVSTNKTSSPLVGLKLSQPSSENPTTTSNINATKTTETPTLTKVPVLSGFTFGTNNPTTNSTSTVSNTTTSIISTKDPKTPLSTTTTSSVITTSNQLNFGNSAQLNSSSQDTNKLNANLQTQESSSQFSSVGTAFTLPTKTTPVSSNTAISAATSSAFTFGTNVTVPTPKTTASNPVSNNVVNPNNSFNFTVPSTSSSVPTAVFGTLTSSSAPASTTSSSSMANTTTSGFTFGSVVTSETNSTTNTPSFTFNTTKPTTKTNETPIAASSGSGNSSISFTFGSNAIQSVSACGTNTKTGLNTQQPSSGFSFNSNTQTQSSSSDVANKSTALKQPETNVFSFGSPSLKPPSTTGGVAPIFSSTSNNLSNSTSIFGSNSNKTDTPTFGSSGENKSATTAVFGTNGSNNSAQIFGASSDNKTTAAGKTSVFGGGGAGSGSNSNTSTPFSFGSKPVIAQTTNTNTAAGGFSFGSASNNSQSAPFSFGTKTSGTATNTVPNTFGGASSTSGQNTSFSFGSSANKPDNASNVFGGAVNKPTENVASPGGFSFGSALSPKTGTFTFGSGGNSFAGGSVSNTNNSTAGFSFGGTAASKPNEISTGSTSGFSFGGGAPSKPNEISTGSTSGFSFGGAATPKPNETSINKPFSFGSSQTQQLLPSNNTASPSNIFGVNISTKPAQPPAFSFNAGNSTNIQSNAPSTNNIFAPPSSAITTGPGDRPIRRATRRLQK